MGKNTNTHRYAREETDRAGGSREKSKKPEQAYKHVSKPKDKTTSRGKLNRKINHKQKAAEKVQQEPVSSDTDEETFCLI